MRLKYYMSHVAYILCSAHSMRTRPQCNALNKIYLNLLSLHKLECCYMHILMRIAPTTTIYAGSKYILNCSIIICVLLTATIALH
jgi:hypothetical protein